MNLFIGFFCFFFIKDDSYESPICLMLFFKKMESLNKLYIFNKLIFYCLVPLIQDFCFVFLLLKLLEIFQQKKNSNKFDERELNDLNISIISLIFYLSFNIILWFSILLNGIKISFFFIFFFLSIIFFL